MARGLRIRKEDVPEGGLRIAMELPPSWYSESCEGRGELELSVPLSIDLTVTKTGGDLRVRGSLSTRVLLDCARCLEPLDWPITYPVDLTFFAESRRDLPKELELTAEDFDHDYYEGEGVDLSDTICEGIHLVLPMKPLCREGCLGLCPTCGANLNQEECSCKGREIDPRSSVHKDDSIPQEEGK